MAGDLIHDLELLKLLVVGFKGLLNFTFANDFNRDFEIWQLVFWKYDQAKRTLTDPPQRFILVNAVFEGEPLGLQDLLMPVRLCIRTREVNRALLRRRAYQ